MINLFIAITLTVTGTIGFVWYAVTEKNDDEYSYSINFRLFVSTISFITLGIWMMINNSVKLTGLILFSCGIGVLIYGLIKRYINIYDSEKHKPKILILVIIMIISGIAITIGELIDI